MAIDSGNGSMASGGSITFSSSIGRATSFGSGAILMSNAGTAGMTGNLVSLSTGTASVDNSGALDIGCKYDLFKYASVIGSCGLDVDLAQHGDGDNTIVGDRGGTAFPKTAHKNCVRPGLLP